jgi:4-nitrophenyl phosphatase
MQGDVAITAPVNLAGQVRGLILDMDGVLYRGNQPIPGARELFPAMRAEGIAYVCLTNNATLTSQDFSDKLARMGISVPPDNILTSAGATAIYLQQQFPEGGGVYVLGEAGLVSSMSSMQAFHLDGWQPNFVVAGLDFDFNYDALQRACSAIRRGAHFIATNADATLPVEGGELWPGAGSIVAAIETCSDVKATVIGKPNIYMADMALQRLGLPADQVLCVGDRLETDILFGARAGIATALVLTGVSTRDDIPAAPAAPTYTFDDLYALAAALGVDTE